MYRYRINKIAMNDGIVIAPGPLTVLVGPNNSGKSRVLKDIVTLATRETHARIVVESLDVECPTSWEQLKGNCTEPWDDDAQHPVQLLAPNLCGQLGFNRPAGWAKHCREHYSRDVDRAARARWFTESFGRYAVALLTTEDRLRLVKASPCAVSPESIENLLQMFFRAGPGAEAEVRALVVEAFGVEVALNFGIGRTLRLHVGTGFEDLPVDPRVLGPALAEERQLDFEGDGMRSFVGIIVALVCVDRPVFLIDEPEAFLHPPQALRVGELIAERADGRRQMIVATHSSDVLRGIVSKRQDTLVVRIDRMGDRNVFRLLKPDQLKEIGEDPLLSSARVLDGLFYSSAVVVEADSDARVYQALSRKRRDADDVHFVNADNKQTVPKVMGLYDKLGVRRAGIVDIDALGDGREFDTSLRKAGVPDSEISDAMKIRDEIEATVNDIPLDACLKSIQDQLSSLSTIVGETLSRQFETSEKELSEQKRVLSELRGTLGRIRADASGWRELKRQGRAALPESLRPRFDSLLAICAKRGLFINPCGELESILADRGLAWTTDKRAWRSSALRLIQSLAVDDTVHPWKFVKSVHDYLENPGEPLLSA